MSDADKNPQARTESTEQMRARFRYCGAVARLPRSIALAEISALPFDELLARLGQIWTEDDPWLFLDQFLKRKLSDDQYPQLSKTVHQLAVDADHLTPKDRDIADRTVYRVLHTLPADLASALALHCAGGKRAKQRQAAYKFYRVHGVDPKAIDLLVADYRRRPNLSILTVIAGDPHAVRLVDAEFLLGELGDSYWSARVFQSLLRSDRSRAQSMAVQYPVAFLWGAAREGDRSALPFLRRLLRAKSDDPEFVGWSLWAFGKLGSSADVALARSAAEALISGADAIVWGNDGPPILPKKGHARRAA